MKNVSAIFQATHTFWLLRASLKLYDTIKMKNKFYFDSMIKQSEKNMHAYTFLKKESMHELQEAQLSKTKCLGNRWKMFQTE